jgi:hypothetical protein
VNPAAGVIANDSHAQSSRTGIIEEDAECNLKETSAGIDLVATIAYSILLGWVATRIKDNRHHFNWRKVT